MLTRWLSTVRLLTNEVAGDLASPSRLAKRAAPPRVRAGSAHPPRCWCGAAAGSFGRSRRPRPRQRSRRRRRAMAGGQILAARRSVAERNVLREVARVTDVDPRVTRPMQDQRRLLDRREQVPDVHPHVHADDVLRHGRARRHPQVPRPPRAVPLVVGRARPTAVPPLAGCPRPVHPGDDVLKLLEPTGRTGSRGRQGDGPRTRTGSAPPPAPGEHGRTARLRVPPSDMPNSVPRREPTASITARMSSIRSSIDGGLSTGSDMPVPRLSNMIKPRERGQPAQKVGQPRFLPGHLHMRDEARHQDQVGGSLTNHLVGDADPTALRILRRPLHHSALQPRSAQPPDSITVEPETAQGTG